MTPAGIDTCRDCYSCGHCWRCIFCVCYEKCEGVSNGYSLIELEGMA